MALFRTGGVEHDFLLPMTCIAQNNTESSGAVKPITVGQPVAITGVFRNGLFIANISGFSGTYTDTISSASQIYATRYGVKNGVISSITSGSDVSNYDYVIVSVVGSVDMSSVTFTFTAA